MAGFDALARLSSLDGRLRQKELSGESDDSLPLGVNYEPCQLGSLAEAAKTSLRPGKCMIAGRISNELLVSGSRHIHGLLSGRSWLNTPSSSLAQT